MTLSLYVLRSVALRTAAAFGLIEGLWILFATLRLAQAEPLLGPLAALWVAPVLAAHGALPSLLLAFAAGAGGTLAGFGESGELAAAASGGLRPARWLAPALLLGAALSCWVLFVVDRVGPRVRQAKYGLVNELLATPAQCLRLLEADPTLVPGGYIELRRGERAEFTQLWALETSAEATPERVMHAERGRVSSPMVGILRFDAEDVSIWSRAPNVEPPALDHVRAHTASLRRPAPGLPRRGAMKADAKEARLAPLARLQARLPEGQRKERARAHLAERIAFALAPLPLALACAVLGLLVASRGAWAGALSAASFCGLVYLPLGQLFAARVGAGAPLVLILVPALATTLVALATLLRRLAR